MDPKRIVPSNESLANLNTEEFRAPSPDLDSELWNEDDFVSTLSRIQEMMEKSSEQQRRIDDKLESLFQKVDTSFKETVSLKQDIDNEIIKEREVGSISIKMLQEQIDELNRRWEGVVVEEKMKADGLLGDLCLTAVYVERAMCTYTWPEARVYELGNLRDLMNVLNGVVSLVPNKYGGEEEHGGKVLEEARERWAIVCEIFDFPDEWKTKTGAWQVSDCSIPNDIRAIEILKARLGGFRVVEKPVSLAYAEQNVELIKYELPLEEYESVTTFIKSLREKMTNFKTGFPHGKLLLD